MKLHILAVGAHPDDVEVFAGGTIIKHIKKGQAVGVIDLTQGELGTRGTIATRFEEATNAAKVMGLAVRENLKMQDGFFVNDKAHQLQLVQKIRKYRPDIVIANGPTDRHPDHVKGFALARDACFLSGLCKIETFDENGKPQEAWRPAKVLHYVQDRHIEPDVLVDISSTFEAKIEAIRCYKTQFFATTAADGPQTYISHPGFLETIAAKAKTLGHRMGSQYAEGFVLEGDYGLSDLDQIFLPSRL